jgi:hypothetical protein
VSKTKRRAAPVRIQAVFALDEQVMYNKESGVQAPVSIIHVHGVVVLPNAVVFDAFKGDSRQNAMLLEIPIRVQQGETQWSSFPAS